MATVRMMTEGSPEAGNGDECVRVQAAERRPVQGAEVILRGPCRGRKRPRRWSDC